MASPHLHISLPTTPENGISPELLGQVSHCNTELPVVVAGKENATMRDLTLSSLLGTFTFPIETGPVPEFLEDEQ